LSICNSELFSVFDIKQEFATAWRAAIVTSPPAASTILGATPTPRSTTLTGLADCHTNLDARLCGLAKLFVVSYVEAFAPCALAPAAAGVAVVSAVRAAVAVVMAVVAAGFTVVVVVLSAIGAITVVAARRLNYVTSV
jgi:hypothetical protein